MSYLRENARSTRIGVAVATAASKNEYVSDRPVSTPAS